VDRRTISIAYDLVHPEKPTTREVRAVQRA